MSRRVTTVILGMVGVLAFQCGVWAQSAYPRAIANWDQAEKDKQIAAGKKLLADLDAAIKEKKTEFSIPKGNYRFVEKKGKRPFYIQLLNVENLTIDGNGSTFWFEDLVTALSIYKCNNVTVKNLIFDWDPLPYTQGTVVSVDPETNTFKLKIEKGYETVCPSFRNTKGAFRGCLFDSKTGKLKPNQVGFNIYPFWDKQDADGNYTVKVRGFYEAKVGVIGFEAGDRFACFPRQGRTIKTECSGKIVLDNITLYASPFIGYVENAGVGPTTYSRCRIVRRPGTTRLMGGNADGFNSANMTHGPILDRCEIDTLGDDFVNIHGVYSRVLKQESPNTLITQGISARGKDLTVLIYDMATSKFLGKMKGTKEGLNYKVEENMFTSAKRKWAAASNVKIGSTVRGCRLVLEKPLTLAAPAYLACEEGVGKGAIIRNCKFTGSLARGIRLQSIGTKITGNRISWCQGWGLSFAGQPGFWGEATHSNHILVKNNLFEDTCIGKSSNPAAIIASSPGDGADDSFRHIHDITITGNTIIRPGGNGITIKNCRNIAVSGNTIKDYGNELSRTISGRDRNKTLPTVGYGVSVTNSTGVKLNANKIIKPAEYAKAKTQMGE